MSDIDILREMFKNNAVLQMECISEKWQAVLYEPAPANYSVTLYNMPTPDETIIIKTDLFTAPKAIFANSRHECKRADFVVVNESKKVIVYIELKAGAGGEENDIISQLKGAQCFIAYCREIGQSFWNNRNFLKNYEHRFVSIRHINNNKRPTRPKEKCDVHNLPDKMLKINSPRGLQFDSLV
jgi:hypothetical protein